MRFGPTAVRFAPGVLTSRHYTSRGSSDRSWYTQGALELDDHRRPRNVARRCSVPKPAGPRHHADKDHEAAPHPMAHAVIAFRGWLSVAPTK